MKKLTLVVMTACVAMASSAYAQTDQEIIDRAVLAAPANARADATVVKWGADGKRVVVRQGKNGLACWDQSTWPHSRTPVNVHCTAEAGLARVDQNREFYGKASSREEAEKAIQAAEKAGTRVPPVYGDELSVTTVKPVSVMWRLWSCERSESTPIPKSLRRG